MPANIIKKRSQAFLRYAGWAFFYFHLVLFIGINSLLIVINLTRNPGTPWFIIPLSAWGLFLLAHFMILFFTNSHSARLWRESKIDPEVLDTLNLGLTNEELYKKNAARSFAWMIFYLHLGIYSGGSSIMLIINYFTEKNVGWSAIAVIAWGLWVLAHWGITYIAQAERLNVWRTRKIKTFIYTVITKETKKAIYNEAILYFGFWIALRVHFFLYLFANLLLAACDYRFNTSIERWFYYPLISWGIFLLAHWLVTFLIISPQMAKWRENNIYKLD